MKLTVSTLSLRLFAVYVKMCVNVNINAIIDLKTDFFF